MALVLALLAGPDPGAARHAWHLALDRLTVGDLDSAYVLIHRARSADPTFISPSLEELRLRFVNGAGSLELSPGEDPVLRCIAIPFRLREPPWADPMSALRAIEDLRPFLDDRRSRECASAFIIFLGSGFGRHGSTPEEWAGDFRRGARFAAGIPQIAIVLATGPWPDRTPSQSVAILRGVLGPDLHPFVRVPLLTYLTLAILRTGDTTEARQVLRQAVVEARRDGRPGIEAQLAAKAWEVAFLLPALPQGIATLEWQARLAHSAGDWRNESNLRRGLAHREIDAGRPVAAIAQARAALRAAVPHERSLALLQARVALGRALAKSGRVEEAIGILRTAIAGAPSSGVRYDLVGAWHNLAHAYEGAGRWAEAAVAADRFVALAAPMRWDGLRAISLHDAGTIKRSAGWHAAAAADFARMVSVIEDQDLNHVWAGEFLERQGQLDAALEHYRRGVAQKEGDPQNEAGVTRVYLAIGRFDSAAAAARRHDADSADWRPLEVPLLPQVLRSQGRTAEAADLLQAWTARRIAAGNIAGGAQAAIDEGEAHLAANQPAATLRAATVAESLAVLIHLIPAQFAAGLLRARALGAMGWHAQALTTVRSVPRGRSVPERDRILAATLEGNLLRQLGRRGEALAAYDRAARIVEGIAGALENDLDRAGYRHGALEPFNAAIDLLLTGTIDPDQTLRWSARRKAAALRAGVIAASADRGVAALRAAVGRGRAFADYLVTDTRVAVVVLTPRSARVIPIAITPDSLARLVARIRAPFLTTVAGRIDLGRARLDTAAARLLGRALIDPIAPELAGARELVVSPDGVLGLLPFDILPGPNGERYLLQRMAVSYAPNARALGLRMTRTSGPVRVILGDAPEAAAEADGIRSAWPPGAVRLYTGAAATESATHPSPSPGILHVAAHAVADGRDPWATHLRLAPDRVDDGYLHLTEIVRQRAAPLVILSACSAVPGPVLGPEGPIGLARAFLAAGSRSVIGTEWPVGPSAAIFSAHLHRYLADGRPPVDAVRMAKLDLLADPATSSPFHWGTWVVFGG